MTRTNKQVHNRLLVVGPLYTTGYLGALWSLAKFSLATVGLIFASAIWSSVFYVLPSLDRGLSQDAVVGNLWPVAFVAAALPLLLFRSDALLKAQGYAWNYWRILGTYFVIITIYMTLCHISNAVGFQTVALILIVGALSVRFYPALHNGAKAGYRNALLIVVLAFGANVGTGPQTLSPTAESVLASGRRTPIVRKLSDGGTYKRSRAANDTTATRAG